MNKNTYVVPQLRVVEFYTSGSLLLPASGGLTTDEALSRGFNNELDEDMTNQSRRNSTHCSWDEEE